MRRFVLGALAFALWAAPALAGDWSSWADLDTVEVVTQSVDGTERATTIWILVQDGTAFVRTSETSDWGNEVAGAGVIALRGDSGERTVRPTLVTDAAARDRIAEGFRAKYGFQDAFIGMFRGGTPRIWSFEVASS